jgi:hypothetical protein
MPLPATEGALAVKEALENIVPTMKLPAIPRLEDNSTWRTHTSFIQVVHYAFETPQGVDIGDYERLEVSTA